MHVVGATEHQKMVDSGVARDYEHAVEILAAMEKRRKRADQMVFYVDPTPVRTCFGEVLVDEEPYCDTNVLRAVVPLDAMNRAMSRAMEASSTMAVGLLKEFVSHPGGSTDEVRLVAFIKTSAVPGKGIFLSPYSAAAVHARRGKTVDERSDRQRIEFNPISGDFVLGMFCAWSQSVYKEMTLVLAIPLDRVLVFHQCDMP